MGTALADLVTNTVKTIDTGKIGQTLSDGIKGFFDFAISAIEHMDWWSMGDTIYNKAKDLIHKTDKRRASYYNYYTNKKWGEAASYELCLNSSELGVQGTAKAIEQYILLKESIEKEARNIV